MNGTSHSIWNENPTFYRLAKRFYSALLTIIYPFAHYCVLRKSPKNFGALKWVIYFHTVCITCEWLSNAFLIDIFAFQPTVVIRLDGLLSGSFDAVTLFIWYTFIEESTSTSALILFTSRLMLIVNMYRPYRSYKRYFLEFLVYLLVTAFGMWSTAITIAHLPDQATAKNQMSQEAFYPDCLFEPSTIVVSDTNSGSEGWIAVLTIVNWISIGIAIFASAKIAFWMLSRRMVNESETTKKMHRKFNQRTIFQAVVYLSFASIPFTALYTTILFEVYIPGLSYFIDFFSENHPTACAVTLFLYYDPYKSYLFEVLRVRKSSIDMGKSSTILVDKSPTFVIRN
ncbi:unnamed protein product [Caenorhabditis sp. 36 PRJEB53466]|nr:unnamed protein product [Caenorhabditis sp. 36 PRJEB53466]